MKTKTIIFTFFLFFSCALLFNACKKYPEDKFMPFRTVKQRLEAEWQIEKIEINGEDVSYKYNDSLAPNTLHDFYFWFVYNKLAPNPNKDDTRDLFLINKSSKCYKDAYNSNDVAIGHFSVDKKRGIISMGALKKDAILDFKSTDIFNNLFLPNTYSEFSRIKSLYHKNFIIQKEKNNNVYSIYFKRTQR